MLTRAARQKQLGTWIMGAGFMLSFLNVIIPVMAIAAALVFVGLGIIISASWS